MPKRGFTIIELLIVMAVIAILVGIAIPSFRGMQTEGWRTRAQKDVITLKVAVETYYKNHGSFPAASGYQTTLLAESPRMIDSTLDDPFNVGTEYVYKLSTNGSYYVIYSVGVDGTGAMTVADTGNVSVSAGSPIYSSNGW
jgi:prepilin-type N-terminal cleavage/methylation domain-containing protein